jgi:hypothetical protein
LIYGDGYPTVPPPPNGVDGAHEHSALCFAHAGAFFELAALAKAAPKINSVNDVTVPERLQAILSLSFLTK